MQYFPLRTQSSVMQYPTSTDAPTTAPATRGLPTQSSGLPGSLARLCQITLLVWFTARPAHVRFLPHSSDRTAASTFVGPYGFHLCWAVPVRCTFVRSWLMLYEIVWGIKQSRVITVYVYLHSIMDYQRELGRNVCGRHRMVHNTQAVHNAIVSTLINSSTPHVKQYRVWGHCNAIRIMGSASDYLQNHDQSYYEGPE